jgi:serine/threonine-protein kinase
MALDTDTRVGPYEITALLGVGGMGEVYRARDTRLVRDVALKTLPAELAADKQRLARFEREAQLLAALNHPHIAAVYGLDEHAGTLYLAMELVDGETLENRLLRGALPVEDALRIALQIADALEAAHAKGVVHRDLKPANVMLTREGQVKVLDFGLAKAFSGPAGEASPAHSPALSLAMTQQGLVLGTAGYMSPEQASGQASDQRADVWAFGVVLFEMLTGKPVFGGESVPHILADVLKGEPDWSRLPSNLHPSIKRLVQRCLTKKPRSRLHSIADARIEIEAALQDPEGLTPQLRVGAANTRATFVRIGGAIAATAAFAAAAGWLLRPAPPREPRPVVRLSLPLPRGQWDLLPTSAIAISPDGTRIAYGREQLYLRNLSETEGHPVPGTAGALAAIEPAFSPDGQWLAYMQVNSLAGPFSIKRVPIGGGAPVVVYEAKMGAVIGLSWPSPDVLLFADDEGIVRIPANGGAAEVLVARTGDERFDSPQLLPGGAVLFTRAAGGFQGPNPDAQLVVQSIGRDDRKVVWSGGSAPRYLPGGQLVYAQGTALFALRFDAGARAVRGGPVPLLQGLTRGFAGVSDTANFAISDTGALAVLVIPANVGGSAAPRLQTTLTWVDRGGREEPLAVRPDDYTFARISPDRTRVALVIGAALGRPPDSRPAIWIYDLRTQNLSLLATEPAINDGPVWSADSSQIFFRSLDALDGRLAKGNVNAIDLSTGAVTTVGTSTNAFPLPLPWEIAPDGKTLAVVNALTLQEVHVATLALESHEFGQLLGGSGTQGQPSFARGGTWIALQEGPSTTADDEINLRPFPAVTRTRIPVAHGHMPVFSRDGSELFFYDGQGIVSMPISYEPTVHVGTPHRLFEGRGYLWGQYGRAWDPDPNGQRFLVIRDPLAGAAGTNQAAAAAAAPADPALQPRIDVVVNWIEELERRLPVDAR